MKRNTNTIQFVQNGILFINKRDLIFKKLNSVDNYKIINKSQFIEEFSVIINKYKFNNKFLTDNMNIIVDKSFNEFEKEIISNIFKELSFNKIDFIDLTSLLKIKNTEIILDISKNYLKIYFNNQIIENKIYFSKYTPIIILYLKSLILKNNIKTIKIFGNYINKEKILMELEKELNIKTYIFSYPELMPIKLLV